MRYPKPTPTAVTVVGGLIGSAVGPVVMLPGGGMVVVGAVITVVSVISLVAGIGNLLTALDYALLDRWKTSVLEEANPDSKEGRSS